MVSVVRLDFFQVTVPFVLDSLISWFEEYPLAVRGPFWTLVVGDTTLVPLPNVFCLVTTSVFFCPGLLFIPRENFSFAVRRLIRSESFFPQCEFFLWRGLFHFHSTAELKYLCFPDLSQSSVPFPRELWRFCFLFDPGSSSWTRARVREPVFHFPLETERYLSGPCLASSRSRPRACLEFSVG